MLDRLPHKLSKGVTATYAGLQFDAMDYQAVIAASFFGDYGVKVPDAVIDVPWDIAFEILQYRAGEPWCFGDRILRALVCPEFVPKKDYTRLHRLAAILCFDAKAFYVLHWCIYNLPEKKESNR